MRKAHLQLLLFLCISNTIVLANKLPSEISLTKFCFSDATSVFTCTVTQRGDAKIYHAGFTKKDSLNNQKLIRRAKLANTLGLSALIGFFVPFINFFSLPLAIAALFIGYSTKNRTTDKAAKRAATKGIIAGWLAIGLIAILTYIIIRFI